MKRGEKSEEEVRRLTWIFRLRAVSTLELEAEGMGSKEISPNLYLKVN